jgi:lysophospholipase L1-like esterase
MRLLTLLAAGLLAFMAKPGHAADWKTAWAAPVQAAYPNGSPIAQPKLDDILSASGAQDQSIRQIIRPSIWGSQVRLRFSNTFGTQPITLRSVYIGQPLGGAALIPGSNRQVSFDGQKEIQLQPGETRWTDPIPLPDTPSQTLAVSFHIVGNSGPLSWHATALTTSYLGARGEDHAAEDQENAWPFATTSTFLLDAVDVGAPDVRRVIVALGDSITDGTGSTPNGYDSWPDILNRRLAQQAPGQYSVVNAGISGNEVAGPLDYNSKQGYGGGPPIMERLERDVLSLSGVTDIIWMEGINDFSPGTRASVEVVETTMRNATERIRKALPGVRIHGATLTSSLASGPEDPAIQEQDQKRLALNRFIKESGLFDSIIDFNAATLDPATGGLRAEFIPSSAGGPGDGLHPNRAGYVAMASVIDPEIFALHKK